jgi:uncharacterized protein
MHIRVEQIADKGMALEFEEPIESFAVLAEMVDEGQCEFLAPIKTALRVQRFGDIVEVEGNISTSARLTCGRCLRKFESHLESRVALTYKSGVPDDEKMGSKQEEFELKEEDMGLIDYQGEEINLQNEIQEQVVMAFPLRALCKPDCKGLCSECGSDLNEGDCSCIKTSSDSRFDALKNLTLDKK